MDKYFIILITVLGIITILIYQSNIFTDSNKKKIYQDNNNLENENSNLSLVSNEFVSNEFVSNEIVSNKIVSNKIVSNEIVSNEIDENFDKSEEVPPQNFDKSEEIFNKSEENFDKSEENLPQNFEQENNIISDTNLNTRSNYKTNYNQKMQKLNSYSDIEYNTTGILSKIIPAEIVSKPSKPIQKINEVNPRIEKFTMNQELLIPENNIQNYVYQLEFPENTSDELPQFNADSVAQIYNVDNITSLYDTINADTYKGYKQLNFI